jgi:ornithine carbamoyltransferase
MAEHPRHFLDLSDHETAELEGILDHAEAMKTARAGKPQGYVEPGRPLDGRILAMIFEKPSTRTRVSFDVAIRQMGGESLLLSGNDLQIGRGETVADTARVLSRFVDAIMIRTFQQEKLAELAHHATIPVINGLTDQSHPCQVMADVLTLREKKGPVADLKIAWSGDSNNVTNSWMHAAARFGFELRVASPAPLQPDASMLKWCRENGANVKVTEDPAEAVDGVDCVLADVWLSIHEEGEGTKHNLLKPYQVDERLMACARQDAVFMHCLPAHRGEEVTAAVIDGPQSVVFDEAENRLHVQKAILAWCLNDRT